MNAVAGSLARPLFRDREAALANCAVLLWTVGGWVASFFCMASRSIAVNILGVLLCAHTMVLAAYLIHEAAHQTLFAVRRANTWTGETMNFIAGSAYGSFDRIRRLHIRHHTDRVDLTCFDFKGLMQRQPLLRRTLEALEWCYVPATEILMHLQVVWRPWFAPTQRPFLARSMAMLAVRLGLLVLLGLWSLKALLLYFVAYGLLLHVLNFFDAFHHTFDQHFVRAEEPIPLADRDRAYEDANTYSNLISRRWPWLNLLNLNFSYHNAHHHRAAVPWYKLPAYHHKVYGERGLSVLPLSELLHTWHRNRVRRVLADDYGVPGNGPGRAARFVGAHGVSFLTVI